MVGKDLLDDVIPFVEQKFRTLKDSDNRALGGLSMGGGQTVAIGFANPDKFHSLVVMSAGGQKLEETYPDFFKDPAATNKKLKLLWVGDRQGRQAGDGRQQRAQGGAHEGRHQAHLS